MAVPGEQESFQSQSFSRPTPKRTTTSGVSDSRNRLAQERKETRQKYFPDRKGVSPLRLDKRKTQADLVDQFKKDFTKPVLTDTGGTVKGVTQMTLDAPMSLSDFRQQTGNKYGPTFREIGSDVRYGLSNIAQGFGDLAVSAMSGDAGLIGAVKTVGNFFLDQANKGYDDLNDVQKQIFDKQTNYKFASQIPEIQAIEKAKNLAIEAQNDALGLSALAASGADATDTYAVGGGGLSSFVNEPIGTFGGSTMGPRVPVRDIQKEQLDAMDIGYVESGQFKEDLQKSGILTVDDPSTQEPLPDSTRIPGDDATIGDLKKALKNQGFNDLQIQSTVNQISRQIISGEYTGDVEVDTGSTTTDDQVSFTPFDNPFNLEFRGQEGAEPGYGPSDDPGRFAKFANLDTGIRAGISRVTDIVGEGKSIDEFLDVYAPRSDNPKSYDNYLATLQEKVGPTIEPNEIKPLTEGIVKFENKPELADQYLNYLEQEKNKLYSGIVS
jgi:hypothetical protein